ncbi:CpsD/CapB family tyrosine-protein kinase [bacterium]|nr:CpsD/CapB family tyrosine-protein kinase [bacterium]
MAKRIPKELYKTDTGDGAIFQPYVLQKPNSTFTESFKILRTNVQFSLKLSQPKTLLITSSNAGEGKTTISANLAISFANAGFKTILIDSDLRVPMVHKEFNLKNEKGLSNYLNEEVEWKSIVHTLPVENLSVITAGLIPPNSAELLSSPRMGSFVKEVLAPYQMAIFDSAPVNLVADTQIISPLMDGVMVIVSSGSTRKIDIQKTRESLQYANVIGYVMNMLFKNAESYYQYRYKSNYYSKKTSSHPDV